MSDLPLLTDLAAGPGADLASAGGPDLAAASDLLGQPSLDSATAPSDLANGTPPDLMTGPVVTRKYVINQFTAPDTVGQYAIDLNGDAKKDDWLGTLNVTLKQYGLPASTDGLNHAVQVDGDPLHLLALTSSEWVNSPGDVQLEARRAVVTPNPVLDGTGTFTVNAAVPASLYAGPILSGRFSSKEPAKATTPVVLSTKVPVLDTFVEVDLVATELTFKINPGGLTEGRLRGAIRDADMQGKLLPVAAAQLDASPNGAQLRQFFDNGGADEDCDSAGKSCRNWDGTCGIAKNGKIEPCELRSQSATKQLFSPDVDLYAGDGTTYSPNPANTQRDSYSIGLAFTAVPATY